jgi:hypothetical protein
LKGEKDVQNDADKNYTFIDGFLEDAVKHSNLCESEQEIGCNFWAYEHNLHTNLSIINNVNNKCMNLLLLPERHTCVLGKGLEIISTHKS